VANVQTKAAPAGRRSRPLGLTDLIDLCRSLRYCITSGMMLREAMDLLAERGTKPVRRVARRVSADLRAGWGLEDALRRQRGAFPSLFLSLVSVGEESGNLPEVLGEVEKYYEMQLKLRRDFRQEIAWPIFQFVSAVLIIAGLIYVVGIVRPGAVREDEPTVDPLGLGLVGSQGAAVFLGAIFGTLAVLWALYRLVRWLLRGRAAVDRFLLLLPALGPCLRALALTRLSVALHLMLDTNLSVLKTFRLALSATDNEAYAAAAPVVEAQLRRGNPISACLSEAGRLFPESFVSAVAVGERSGRLPEMFRIQADRYDDEVKRRLGLLNRVLSVLVWLTVAGIIVFAIFRIFTSVYLHNLERYLPK
jgi:type IV pilus assembly protein PilC